MLERLARADGILIPGGFGGRGIEGKIAAARVAREQGIPYLGICLGMQIAVAEFARNVAGMEGANSTEFDLETPFPVIDLLPEQKEVADLGGTMRLGADPIKLHAGTRAREIYGEAVIYERHRHRYEVNNLLRKRLQSAGLCISGTSPDERLVEVVELDGGTPSSSPPSSIPSSSPAPSARRRCFATSSPPRWSGPRRAARAHAQCAATWARPRRRSPTDRERGSPDRATLRGVESGRGALLRVETVFHVADESQGQAVAAKLIDRAHELANSPECECDVDVSVEWVRPEDPAADPGGVPTAAGAPSRSASEHPAER